jgi:diguanylate cyclase (GGDEF)-like protein
MSVSTNASTREVAAVPSPGEGPARAQAGLGSRLTCWLLTSDRDQRIRLMQSGVANLLMWVCVALMHVLDANGTADHRWVWPWTIGSVGGLLAPFVLIRSGYARHWREPSLTLPQQLFGTLSAACAYCITGEARAVVLPIVAVVMMFGMFGLTQRNVRIVGAWTMTLFGAASLYWLNGPERGLPAAQGDEIVRFVMVGTIVTAVVVLTSQLYGMRERIGQQREQLTAALERIRELATRDELTGCLNRRAMLERLAEESTRCQRSRQSMCLVLIDLDHFKRINDIHGHAAGDSVLRSFAEIARRELRGTDLLARWGGEEFLLMLGATDVEQGVRCVQRLLDTLAAEHIRAGRHVIAATASAGLVECHGDEDLAELLERADQALYRAKANGRNRLERASPFQLASAASPPADPTCCGA